MFVMKKNIQPIPFKVLLEFISPINVFGDLRPDIIGYAPIENSTAKHLSFCNRKDKIAVSLIKKTKGGIILCDGEVPDIDKLAKDKCILTVKNPRLKFIQCINHFFKPKITWGVHPTAIIEQDAIIDVNTYVGAMAYVGSNVKIGGGTIIENRVQIISESIIGKNVYLQNGAVIGCEGQGFERNEKGVFEKFYQNGIVVLEDDVEIGANSTIVRGALSETRIGRGSKIGHLANIGHNVKVGKHVFISAGVVVCGSCIIGDFSWLAPKCCIRNKITLGKEVTVGLGSVVTKDVPDKYTIVGVPARPIRK